MGYFNVSKQHLAASRPSSGVSRGTYTSISTLDLSLIISGGLLPVRKCNYQSTNRSAFFFFNLDRDRTFAGRREVDATQ